MRHSLTVPGIGDPPGFRLDDCSTQRNLSDEGRAQARRLGDAFRSAGVPVGEVLSSRWCRCIDTATLAFGKVAHYPAIDSFFDRPDRGVAANAGTMQTAELRKRIASHRGKDTLVLVTHQVNVTALTGIYPAMGEFVVLRPGGGKGFTVVGRASVP
jgi:phosphohistidine phosphatase SixA